MDGSRFECFGMVQSSLIYLSHDKTRVTAMGLIWQYGEVTGNSKWKGMTWGMVSHSSRRDQKTLILRCLFWVEPFVLVRGISSTTIQNSKYFFRRIHLCRNGLQFLVTLQAALTFVGNGTCGIAAYRIYEDSQKTDANSISNVKNSDALSSKE